MAGSLSLCLSPASSFRCSSVHRLLTSPDLLALVTNSLLPPRTTCNGTERRKRIPRASRKMSLWTPRECEQPLARGLLVWAGLPESSCGKALQGVVGWVPRMLSLRSKAFMMFFRKIHFPLLKPLPTRCGKLQGGAKSKENKRVGTFPPLFTFKTNSDVVEIILSERVVLWPRM